MDRALVLLTLLLVATPLCIALDIATTLGPYLVNSQTNGSITLNGLWYSLSNKTTDINALDPLTDPEACTRDAALMDLLGVNTIYVNTLDPTENHDDCFSIFNSVGIYVVLVLRKDGAFGTDADNTDAAYSVDSMRQTFEIITAVMDYENLLGVDIGVFPYYSDFKDYSKFAGAQKLYRAFIRDTKEYIASHSRPIIVGGTFNWAYELTPQWSDFLSCAIEGEGKNISRADYLSYYFDYDLDYGGAETMSNANNSFNQFVRWIINQTVPTWLSRYDSEGQIGAIREIDTTDFNETKFLYDGDWNLLAPYGPLAGGVRFEWTNVGLSDPAVNYSFVNIDNQGNVELTERFDTLRGIFSPMNTDRWLGGDSRDSMTSYVFDTAPKCAEELIANKTTEIADGSTTTTMALATNWDLPSRPAGLDALITSGASGTRGQMVDVTVTTIVHTIKDSKGSVMTDVVLKPSKSSPRVTTARITNGPTSTSDGALSTGAKAGIGVGAGVGGLLIAGVLGLFLFRRRRSKKVATKKEEEKDPEVLKGTTAAKFEKAELSTGPEVEAQPAEPPAELPTGASPKEAPVDGRETDGYPGMHARMDGPLAELPAVERPLEMPVQTPVREDARRSDR